MKKYFDIDTGTIFTHRELELMYEIAVLKNEIDKDEYENVEDCIIMSDRLFEIKIQYCVVCRTDNDGILTVRYAGREEDAEAIMTHMVRNYIYECDKGSCQIDTEFDNYVLLRHNDDNVIFTIEEIEED